MADHHPADGNIFVYTGGHAPHHVINVIIDQSITVIDPRAFEGCLVESVECHDELERIEERAFAECRALKKIKIPGVKVICSSAFYFSGVIDVEFGDKLITIELQAFKSCSRLKRVRMPSVRNIGMDAFRDCSDLEYVELSEELQRISNNAFDSCMSLKHITIPLKQNMIMDDVFFRCRQLTAVDLAGGVQKIVSYLHFESWKNEMNERINQINHDLPNTPSYRKSSVIREWIESIDSRMRYYKFEHYRLLQEATTLLELALWKAKLDEDDKKNMPDDFSKGKANIATTNVDDERKYNRITSGASIVIKNILPFLELP